MILWQTGPVVRLREVFPVAEFAAVIRRITPLDVIDRLSLLTLVAALVWCAGKLYEALYVVVNQ